MTCYLRLHELVVAVPPDVTDADWDVAHRRWLQADGVRSAARVVPQLLAWVSAEASRGAEVAR